MGGRTGGDGLGSLVETLRRLVGDSSFAAVESTSKVVLGGWAAAVRFRGVAAWAATSFAGLGSLGLVVGGILLEYG